MADRPHVSAAVQDHPDNRGVWVPRWVLRTLDGDYAVAVLLGQLLWWHQRGLDGRTKLTTERDGWRWLLRADDEWEDETCLNAKQVRRARKVLVEMGVIECRRFKRDGAPTSAWRPLYERVQELANCPIPEVPPEGQFQGSDPVGAVGSDPAGAVPIPLPTNREITGKGASRAARRLPNPFPLTGDMRRWAAESAPLVILTREHDKFCDYWRGSGKTKADWDATWRNWMRKAQEDAERKPGRWRPPQTNQRITTNTEYASGADVGL